VKKYLDDKVKIEDLSNPITIRSCIDGTIKTYKDMVDRERSKARDLKLKIMGTHADEISNKQDIEDLASNIIKNHGEECEMFALAKAKPGYQAAVDMQKRIKKFIYGDT